MSRVRGSVVRDKTMAMQTAPVAIEFGEVQQAAIEPRDRRRTSALGVSVAAGLLAAHAPLGLAIHESESVATAHALATLAVAAWGALRYSPQWLIYAGLYITGAEVLWRMSGAHVFWEFGKYTLVLLFLLGAVRYRATLKLDWLALTYFLCLTPAALALLVNGGVNDARLVSHLSFVMSGPLALTLGVMLLQGIRVDSRQLRWAAIALSCPLAAIASITVVATYATPGVEFGLGSNFATSGGYGPNQVAAILALGATVCLLVLIVTRLTTVYRLVIGALVVLFAGQSAMTFSRGGLYSMAAALTAAVVLGLPNRFVRRRSFLGIAALAVIVVTAGVRLDTFTGGKLQERLENTSTTGRVDLMREDLAMWLDHPVMGVGPGRSREYREHSGATSHTEYTRMLAEHGILGLVSVAALLALGVRRLRHLSGVSDRVVAGGLMAWSIATMMHASMRIAAPAFVFALSMVTALAADEDDGRSPDRPSL